MKKIMAILALAIMLISIVPSAFADIGVDVGADVDATISADSDTDAETTTETKTRVNTNSKTRINAKIDAFKTIRENRAETRTEIKARLENARNEWRDAKEDGLSEEERFAKAKAFMLVLVDKMIANHNSIIAKVEANNNLRINVISNMEQRVDLLTELRADIEAAKNMQELRESAKEMKKEWATSRKDVKLKVSQIVNSKFERAISILEKSATRIDAKLEAMAEEGTDVSAEEALLTEAYAEIESAKRNYEASVEVSAKIKTAASVEEAQKYFEESKKYINSAKSDVSEAKDKLKSISASLKAEGEIDA